MLFQFYFYIVFLVLMGGAYYIGKLEKQYLSLFLLGIGGAMIVFAQTFLSDSLTGIGWDVIQSKIQFDYLLLGSKRVGLFFSILFVILYLILFEQKHKREFLLFAVMTPFLFVLNGGLMDVLGMMTVLSFHVLESKQVKNLWIDFVLLGLLLAFEVNGPLFVQFRLYILIMLFVKNLYDLVVNKLSFTKLVFVFLLLEQVFPYVMVTPIIKGVISLLSLALLAWLVYFPSNKRMFNIYFSCFFLFILFVPWETHHLGILFLLIFFKSNEDLLTAKNKLTEITIENRYQVLLTSALVISFVSLVVKLSSDQIYSSISMGLWCIYLGYLVIAQLVQGSMLGNKVSYLFGVVWIITIMGIVSEKLYLWS